MSQRKSYPSDLSDARWALIEPTLTAWRKARLDRRPTGQPAKVDLRDVFNALLYVNRTGIPWKYLPHDFPGHGTVYFYYAAWRGEGVLAQLNYDRQFVCASSGVVAEVDRPYSSGGCEARLSSRQARGERPYACLNTLLK